MKRFLPSLAVAVLAFVIGVVTNTEANRIADYLWPDFKDHLPYSTPSSPIVTTDTGKAHPQAQSIAHSRGH